MLLETVSVVAAVVEAPFEDAEEGSQGSMDEEEDEEGRASSHTRGAEEEGDSDTCSKDELQPTQEHEAAAAAAGAVELYLLAVVVAVVVFAVEAVVKYRKGHEGARLGELLAFSVVPLEADTDPKFCSPPQVCSLYSRMMDY